MPDEKDQELDTLPPSSESEAGKEAESKVGEAGAETERGSGNKDAIIQRLQKQRDRERERAERSETELRRSQQPRQPSFMPAPQQPTRGVDWTRPDQSINEMVDSRVREAVTKAQEETTRTIRIEAQVEKAREHMQAQKGYNQAELEQVFEDHPELNQLAETNPFGAAKIAVKIWKIGKGDFASFDKKAAAGGILPTSPPGGKRGPQGIFDKVKGGDPSIDQKDLDKVWDELDKAEQGGAQIAF